jgi:two-component system, cell cycle response regulator DivK
VNSSAGRCNRRLRILVIEDDYANRLFFSEYLNFCGFEVLALPNGLDLEMQLKTFEPHLLVLDIGLPEIDGYTLLSQLRAAPPWQDLPVVVVSGYAFAKDQKKAFALGAQQYLVKPVRLRELFATIGALLDLTPSVNG